MGAGFADQIPVGDVEVVEGFVLERLALFRLARQLFG